MSNSESWYKIFKWIVPGEVAAIVDWETCQLWEGYFKDGKLVGTKVW